MAAERRLIFVDLMLQWLDKPEQLHLLHLARQANKAAIQHTERAMTLGRRHGATPLGGKAAKD